MKSTRTDDFRKDTELLKGTPASNAHGVASSEETATQTGSLSHHTFLQGTQKLPKCDQ